MDQLKAYLFRRNDRVYPFKRNSKTNVNYFQNRRWQLVTLVEQLCGFWPHQSKLKQYSLRFFFTSVMALAILVALNELSKHVGVDTEITFECCLLTIFYVLMLFKLLLVSLHQYSRRNFYKRIVEHFEKIVDPEEAAVLSEASEQGFKFAVYYICSVSAVLGTFNCMPILRSFHDYVFNHCEFKMEMPVRLDFGFDHGEYWYVVAIAFVVWVYSAILLEFTSCLSFKLQVLHVAALFKIVGIRIRRASEIANEFESQNESMSDDNADQSYLLISSAIDLHSEIFELVKLIEESYTTTWFVILLLSTVGFGAGIHLISTKFHDPLETFRYVAAFMVILLHYHLVFSQGQLIIDSAKLVSDACCECKWYGLPIKSCKLLSMMMIRTSIPCQLTGAKLFPLSIETFGKMSKAGLSYYTVFQAKLR